VTSDEWILRCPVIANFAICRYFEAGATGLEPATSGVTAPAHGQEKESPSPRGLVLRDALPGHSGVSPAAFSPHQHGFCTNDAPRPTPKSSPARATECASGSSQF
jgi:hypothetical protein